MSDLEEDPHTAAKKLSLETGEIYDVVLPKDNELQVDIDSIHGMETFKANYNRLVYYLPDRWKGPQDISYVRTPSREVGHFHITVKLPFEPDWEERILLQALLGSDPTREMLSLVRVWKELDRPPTCFFERRAIGLLPAHDPLKPDIGDLSEHEALKLSFEKTKPVKPLKRTKRVSKTVEIERPSEPDPVIHDAEFIDE